MKSAVTINSDRSTMSRSLTTCAGWSASWIFCVFCLVMPLPTSASGGQEASQTPLSDTQPIPAAVPDAPRLNAVTSGRAERGPTDPADLEAFVDGIMAVHLKEKRIAGATFAFVADNKPFFAKGYGYADVARKKPVDPDETMFRIGSVSKLFTWTAIMQLAEQGKLDLDADINNYLSEFKIPTTYPEPITLKHLLAHTPGFEDRVIGLFARSADQIEPLGKILARDLPSRVRPPGELASYSNHGTALAGYIVAQVAGMPWEEYVEQNILRPLEMGHTSLRQPATDKLPAAISKGYKFERGEFVEGGFEYVPAAPAGSFSASAGDMVKFMIAHLQDGRFGSTRILKEATARQMRSLLFTHDPSLAGMAYGFMRMTYNGEQIVQHGGDTFLFHSYLVMLPERKAGFFVSYNTETGAGVREKLFEALLDRYYPATAAPVAKLADERQNRTSHYAGSYEAIRYSHSSIAKLGALFGVATVEADGDELLVGAGPFSRRFVEVEPRIFREIDGQATLAFREDPSGHVTHLFAGNGPAVALVKLPWSETPQFQVSLVVGCIVVCLSALVGWPILAFAIRGNHDEGRARSSAGSRWASWLAWLFCLLLVAQVSLSMIPLSSPDDLAYGVSPLVAALLWCAPLLAAFVAALAVCTILAWKNGYWRLSGRLHYTSVLLAGIAFVWFLQHWNLLRFGA